MEKEQKVGTAWQLQLQPGDLVLATSCGFGAKEGESLRRVVSIEVSIVVGSPKRAEEGVTVFVLAHDDSTSSQKLGNERRLHSRFCQFRLLLPADLFLKQLPRLIQGLQGLQSELEPATVVSA